MATIFKGNRRHYRWMALALGYGTHAYLYAAFVAYEYGVRGETWMFGWKPTLAVVLSASVLARLAYQSIMNLDGQYGRGSRWELNEQRVKLPQERD